MRTRNSNLALIAHGSRRSTSAPPASNRREHERRAARELAWLNLVRVKYGPAVSLLDLSAGVRRHRNRRQGLRVRGAVPDHPQSGLPHFSADGVPGRARIQALDRSAGQERVVGRRRHQPASGPCQPGGNVARSQRDDRRASGAAGLDERRRRRSRRRASDDRIAVRAPHGRSFLSACQSPPAGGHAQHRAGGIVRRARAACDRRVVSIGVGAEHPPRRGVDAAVPSPSRHTHVRRADGVRTKHQAARRVSPREPVSGVAPSSARDRGAPVHSRQGCGAFAARDDGTSLLSVGALRSGRRQIARRSRASQFRSRV